MERLLMTDLRAWKDDPARKPLVLSGARQVGKTWLLNELGRREFDNVAYLNFERDAALTAVFDGTLDPAVVIDKVRAVTHERVDAGHTLLVFDEVQMCPRALTSLKYFCEEAPQYHVACAGSLLGVALPATGASFPVGKVDTLELHPMTFAEFLLAAGEDALADVACGRSPDLLDAVAGRLEYRLRQYYYVGGMPEAVDTFLRTGDYDLVQRVQRAVIDGYMQDIVKHSLDETGARVYDPEKVRAVWKTIPSQLSREQKRFQYKGVKSGARARDYAFAIEWLKGAGIVCEVPRVTEPQLPLAAHADYDDFKLFVLDVGILSAMCEVDSADVVLGSELFARFKGALTEQYVCQQLVAGNAMTPYYWSQSKPRAEVDFLVECAGRLIAVETKAERNLAAASLQLFGRRSPHLNLVRASMAPPAVHGCVAEVPLYLLQDEARWTAGPTSRALYEEACREKAASLNARRGGKRQDLGKGKDIHEL